jgi:hypothetical protein
LETAAGVRCRRGGRGASDQVGALRCGMLQSFSQLFGSPVKCWQAYIYGSLGFELFKLTAELRIVRSEFLYTPEYTVNTDRYDSPNSNICAFSCFAFIISRFAIES